LSGYLRPTAPIAADALLVADPGQAMALAQAVLEKPLMANHHHGLWGYSGVSSSGRAITVQSTGIGGPSAAAVAGELALHGVKRAIRVGWAEALDTTVTPGTIVVATDALGLDGICRALGSDRPAAHEALTAELARALGSAPSVTVAGYDLPVSTATDDLRQSWIQAGAKAADGETAALLATGERSGLDVAVGLVIGESELIELGERAASAFDQLG
jgi:uridine phosphorylase